ncbi:MAG: four-carbon acid sugar kinase family protein [Dehalococcoidia bacterium]|nr:four-carbon acid sugar kinase family protein [Dehalococcoidia bacterium]
MNTRGTSRLRIGIYADDLTGALDAAAPFAAVGMSTYVSVFGIVPDDDARTHRVLSLNVGTRHADRFPVFDKAARAVQELRATGFRLLVNKIDSTLRGHAGMEARAGLSPEPSDPRDIGKTGSWSGPRLALIAPSFPAMGRIVSGGQVLVNGIPLPETEVGRDPLTPVNSSDIAELVELNTGIRPTFLSLYDVRADGRLHHRIAELSDRPPVLAVCDAESDEDMKLIAAAFVDAGGEVILSGSAGVTNALAEILSDESQGRPEPASNTGGRTAPSLIVSGSQRSLTGYQLKLASDNRSVEWLQIDPVALLDEDLSRETRDNAVSTLVSAMEDGKHAAVSLCQVDVTGDLDVPTKLVRELGAICYRVARRTRPGAVVIIGGDTAQAALRAVGAAGIVMHGQPFPGIPAGTVDGGLLDGVRVVTKAGAFGDQEILVDIIDYLTCRRPEDESTNVQK